MVRPLSFLIGPGSLADVAVQEFAKRPLANEADAGGVFLLGVGQADLQRDATHLGFEQFTHREQGVGQLRLVQPVQEVALVFGRVQALEQFMQAGVARLRRTRA